MLYKYTESQSEALPPLQQDLSRGCINPQVNSFSVRSEPPTMCILLVRHLFKEIICKYPPNTLRPGSPCGSSLSNMLLWRTVIDLFRRSTVQFDQSSPWQSFRPIYPLPNTLLHLANLLPHPLHPSSNHSPYAFLASSSASI